MKPTSVIRQLLVGATSVSLLLGTAMGAENTSQRKDLARSHVQNTAAKAKPDRIVLVYVTGSLIPQRVVISGQQVNSSSPLFVLQGDELLRSGATNVGGMLAMDPSISFGRRR